MNGADPALVNAWGITWLTTSPFWLGDNGTGESTLYNSLGQKQALVVTIPAAGGRYGYRRANRGDRKHGCVPVCE
jgi:hypothetical protein